LLVPWRWWLPGGIPVTGTFVGFVWIALGGCLLDARWDLPFRSIPLSCCLWSGARFSSPSRELDLNVERLSV
jgi:hypothetical protein